MSTDADLQAEIRPAKTLAGVSAAAGTISILESGLQLFMAIYGLPVWLDTSEEQRKRRLPYILLSFAILILSVIPTYLGVADEFKVLYNSGPGIEYLDMKDAVRSKWNQMLSYGLIYAGNSVANGVLLYRCYLVWFDLRWIIILPGAIFLVLIGLSAYTLYEISKLDQNATANVHLSVAMLLLNVIFYILVTSLIIFRLLRGHSAVAKVLPGRSFTAHRGAISILVESALPLTICGFISGVVNAHINIGKGTQKWVTMFAALAPQMIIFRVTTGHSFTRHEETQVTHPQSRVVLSQPIAFNNGSGDETSDYEAGAKYDGRDMSSHAQSKIQ